MTYTREQLSKLTNKELQALVVKLKANTPIHHKPKTISTPGGDTRDSHGHIAQAVFAEQLRTMLGEKVEGINHLTSEELGGIIAVCKEMSAEMLRDGLSQRISRLADDLAEVVTPRSYKLLAQTPCGPAVIFNVVY